MINPKEWDWAKVTDSIWNKPSIDVCFTWMLRTYIYSFFMGMDMNSNDNI